MKFNNSRRWKLILIDALVITAVSFGFALITGSITIGGNHDED